MKILYITVPSFFDLEISLIRELSKLVNVRVLLIVQPESLNSSAFSIDKISDKPCIISSTEFEQMAKYNHLIDLNIWDVAINPDNSFQSCFKLSSKIKRYIESESYDIVHCTSICKTLLFLSGYFKKIQHTILTIHDPIPHESISLLRRFINYMYIKSFNNYIILNQQFIEIIRKISTEKSIFVSSLGIYDYLRSYMGNMTLISGPYILFTGRISYYKGIDILVKAYNLSDAPKKNVKLVIAGKGKIEGLNQSDITENIILINRYIENDELAYLIDNCKFGILPYRSATQSGVLMSFYAFNKPVVATRVGDLPVHVSDGINGYLSVEDNISSLVVSINKMLNSDITRFSNKIRCEYSNDGNKSWRTIANDMTNNYFTILGNSK